MNNSSLKNLFFAILLVVFNFAPGVFAQTQNQDTKQVNFRYSQNPKTKAKVENRITNSTLSVSNSGKTTDKSSSSETLENRSIASKTLEIAKRANKASASPTEIYKIGQGDILIISLQNAPGNATNYFTVLSDGTIDYPLAGEMVPVQGLTTEEIEDLLQEKIKLYKNPQLVVKVREFASHSFTVLGLVEKAGEKFLQREAMPLYAVRAEAITKPNVTVAIIKRINAETEKIIIADPKSDDILIFPGDIVEFKSGENEINREVPPYYFIGGNINSAGQKDYHQGLTLTQAILASGGMRRSSVKKVIIRRKNQEELLSSLEFDLNAIKSGKQVDPVLQAGDTIEIGN